MSGDTLGYHNLGDEREVKSATGILWVETRDIAKHSTMRRTIPHNKESCDTKCQWCCG